MYGNNNNIEYSAVSPGDKEQQRTKNKEEVLKIQSDMNYSQKLCTVITCFVLFSSPTHPFYTVQ